MILCDMRFQINFQCSIIITMWAWKFFSNFMYCFHMHFEANFCFNLMLTIFMWTLNCYSFMNFFYV